MPRVSLTPEDLARWRLATADKELVDACFPGISVEEGRRALLTYYKVMGDLFQTYEQSDNEGATFLSPVDGGFYSVSSSLG